MRNPETLVLIVLHGRSRTVQLKVSRIKLIEARFGATSLTHCSNTSEISHYILQNPSGCQAQQTSSSHNVFHTFLVLALLLAFIHTVLLSVSFHNHSILEHILLPGSSFRDSNFNLILILTLNILLHWGVCPFNASHKRNAHFSYQINSF